MNRAVFLDRDGVINKMVYNPEFGLVDSPGNPEEFKLTSGAADAICQINRLGLLAIVVSNQPGIAKGRFTLALHDAITDKMHKLVGQAGGRLDGVYYCLHHPHALYEEYRDVCICRKPKPGLLLQAAREWQIDLAGSFMVGDGLTDMIAGQFVGARNILISSRKCYICDEIARQEVQPDFVVGSLADAVQVVQKIESGDGHDLGPYSPMFQLPAMRRFVSSDSISNLGRQ